VLCYCFVQLTGQCKDISRHLATPVYAWLIVRFETFAGTLNTLQAFPSAVSTYLVCCHLCCQKERDSTRVLSDREG
jgi:hypothetical protein